MKNLATALRNSAFTLLAHEMVLLNPDEQQQLVEGKMNESFPGKSLQWRSINEDEESVAAMLRALRSSAVLWLFLNGGQSRLERMLKRRDEDPPVLHGATGTVGDGDPRNLTHEFLTGPKHAGQIPLLVTQTPAAVFPKPARNPGPDRNQAPAPIQTARTWSNVPVSPPVPGNWFDLQGNVDPD